MRHTLTIAAREMRDQSFILVAAVVLAVTPFAGALWVPSARGARSESIAVLGFSLAITYAVVVALMLGLTIIGRELSEKRLSFYFARPLPATAVWFGKLAAAVVLSAAAFAIIALPAAIAARQAWESVWTMIVPWGIGRWTMTPIASVGLAALLGLAVIVMAHAASTAVRSRSPLVFVDLVAVGACLAAGWLIIRPLAEGLALFVTLAYLAVSAVVILLTFVAAGAWQVSRARVDVQRNHYELSKFVWAVIALFLMVAGLFTAWFVSVGPGDLNWGGASMLPRGNWATIEGRYRGRADYRPALLYNVVNGRFMRLPGIDWQITPSLDGKSIAWSSDAIDRREINVTTLADRPSTVATGIHVGPADTFVLSSDGKRIAILSGKSVAIYELANGRLVGSARVPYQAVRLFFVSPDILRMISVYPFGAQASGGVQGIHISEFNARTKQIVRLGDLDLGESSVVFTANADGSRLLVQHASWKEGWNRSREVLLVNGRSAAVLANLGRPGAGRAATFLDDGSILTGGAVDRRATLHVYSAEGVPLRSIDLGPGDGVHYPVTVSPNRVAVWLRTWSAREFVPGKTKITDCMAIVDLLEKQVIRKDADLKPGWVFWKSYYQDDPRVVASEPNRPLLLNDSKGALWKWDPATGQKTRISGE